MSWRDGYKQLHRVSYGENMRWTGILALAIVLGLFATAYAAPFGPKVAPVKVVDENGNVVATVRIGAEGNEGNVHIMATVRNRGTETAVRAGVEVRAGMPVDRAAIEEMRRRFGGKLDVNAIIQRAREKRAEVRRMIERGMQKMEEWRRVAQRYREIAQRVRETAAMYRERLQEWYRYRRMFLEGNIDEAEYVEKTKEMLYAAIDATIQRLQIIAQYHPEANVENAIARLEELKAELNGVTDLNTLRELYRESILPVLRENQRMFFHFYAVQTLDAAESIVVRLDVAAARLAVFVDRAKALGVYDENMDAQVNTVLAEIEAVKTELNSIRTELEQGTITETEYLQKIAELRREIYRIYMEIRDLLRTAMRLRVHVQAGTPAGETEVNAEVSE